MDLLIILAVFVAGAAIVLALLRREKAPAPYPYQLTKFLLSKAERSFYGALVQAVGETGTVFSKIRVADVLRPRKGLDRAEWQRAFNAISSKHFDFLICDPHDCSIKCAVELDDASHDSSRAKNRDQLVNGACDAAGLPLLRLPAANSYVIAELRDAIHALISNAPDSQAKIPDAVDSQPRSDSPRCPKCAESMVLRIAKTGANAGNQFWGCPTFPKCRGVVQVDS